MLRMNEKINKLHEWRKEVKRRKEGIRVTDKRVTMKVEINERKIKW